MENLEMNVLLTGKTPAVFPFCSSFSCLKSELSFRPKPISHFFPFPTSCPLGQSYKG